MDWSKGFSGAYYASEVDKRTWKDIDRFEITGGSIEFTDEGLRSSADIDCVRYDKGREIWVRIWMDARQEGDASHVALFTGLACAPDRDVNGNYETNKVKCYSVLQPCESVLLERGWYAPAGVSAETVMKDLLTTTPAPVEVIGTTPNLDDNIVAEEGENHLSMVEKILTAIGWRMQISGEGHIIISENADSESMIMSKDYDIIQTSFTESYDWYSAPNVFRAVTDTRTVTKKDESDGPLSIESRGREIWMEETDCNLSDGESLEGYAERRLKEEQAVAREVSYTRRYVPDVMPSDIVRICYPKQGVDGKFYISSQGISLGQGAPVSEEVRGIE